MNFSCDNCGAEYRVADSKLGSHGIQVKCKKCDNPITVLPEQETVEESELVSNHADSEDAFSEAAATLVMQSSELKDLAYGSSDSAEPELARDEASDLSALANAAVENYDKTVIADFDPPTEAFSPKDFEAMRLRAEGPAGDFEDGQTLQMPMTGLAEEKDLESQALASLGSGRGSEEPNEEELGADSEAGLDEESGFEDGLTQEGLPTQDNDIETRQWYVAIDGEQVGPMLAPTLQVRYMAQEIDDETLVWSTGMADWQVLQDVAGLASYLGIALEESGQEHDSRMDLAGLKEQELGALEADGADKISDQDEDFSEAGDTVVIPGAYEKTEVTALGSELSDLVQEEMESAHAEDGVQSAPVDSQPETHEDFESTAEVASVEEPAPVQASESIESVDTGLSNNWSVPKRSLPPVGTEPNRLLFILGGLVIVLALALVFVLVTRPAANDVESLVNKRVEEVLKQVQEAKPIKPIKTPVKQQKSAKVLALEPIVDNMEGAQNSLTLEQIVSTTKDYMGDVEGCFRQSYDRQQLAAGSYNLNLDWLIGVNGRVSEPTIKGADNVMITNVPSCISDRMLLWQFPPAKTPSPVRNFGLGPIVVP